MSSSRRRFYLFWAGDTINALGSSVTLFLLPLIAIESLRASTFQVGLITTVRWLPGLVIGLPAGAWAERREK
ncbi:MAG TPA: hypothetical protein VMD59_12510, partial [Acidimicrobiales bacterium]|nr:hypothetical protein [Acidimicrobiales bacterium]